MQIIIVAKKLCSQLVSNEIYFDCSCFSGVKTDEEVIAEGLYSCGTVKKIYKGFCIATLEKLIRYYTGGSYLVIKITPIFPVYSSLVSIGYKNNSRKVLVFISTGGSGSTEPCYIYLYHFPYIYSGASFHPVVYTHFLVRYLNAFNSIDNHNRMRKFSLAIEKCWVTQSVYFRLVTTVTSVMGITDGNVLFCNVVP